MAIVKRWPLERGFKHKSKYGFFVWRDKTSGGCREVVISGGSTVHHQKRRLWSPTEDIILIFNQVLSTSLLRRCMEISLENLYVDIGSQRVKTTVSSLWHSHNMHKVSVFERQPVTREPKNKTEEWQSRFPLFLGRCPSLLTSMYINVEILSYGQFSDPSDWDFSDGGIVARWLLRRSNIVKFQK